MTETAATFLLSPTGEAILQRAAATPGDVSARVLALRGKEAPEVVRLAVEIVVARERANRRGFADAARLFFTTDALAQATSPVLAAYRARYLGAFGTVADLCCGAGMDAIALADAGASVIAVDIDPVRLLFARRNAALRGVADRITFLEEPVESLGWTSASAAFFDPARRTDAGRVSRHGDRYAPPLDFLHTIRQHVRGGCAKLSPALPDDVLRDLNPSRVEFLSENRECKEACVWFGDATGVSGMGDDYTAVHLPYGDFLPDFLNHQDAKDAKLGEEGFNSWSPSVYASLASWRFHYLLDPNPAVIRAGALDALCTQIGGAFVSDADSYLQAAEPVLSPWASVYRIVHTLPYAPKKVAAWLRENGVARIVVKKRHFPKEPDAVAREIGVSVRGDGKEITLVLVRGETPTAGVRDAPNRFTAVLCESV